MSGRRPPERLALEARWLELTRATLPALADQRGWPISADHCFQRVLLDNAAGRCWYEVVDQRPAYAHASDALLRRAIEIGEAVIAGADIAALNRQSLAYRGKLDAPRGFEPR